MVRLLTFALLCAAFLLASCGSTSLQREASKRGYDYYQAQSDVAAAGSPCTVRCTVTPASSDAIEVKSWSWGVSNGRIVDQNVDGSEIWVTMVHQGDCTVQARGVDNEGRDCTTPKHKFSSSRRVNAEPVVVVDGGLNPGVEHVSKGDGTTYDVGHALWRSRSYDPDYDNPFVTHNWTMTLPGADGTPYVVASLLDGVAHNADLDNDGLADIEMAPTPGSPGDCTISFVFRSVEHDPAVMYDLHYEGITARGGRKGWDGCIYGNRPPGNK